MDLEEEYQRLSPCAVEVEANEIYSWCGCGLSAKRPLCDGSGNCTKAVEYLAAITETVYFCGCGQTKSPPLCDGTHGKLLLQLLQGREQ